MFLGEWWVFVGRRLLKLEDSRLQNYKITKLQKQDKRLEVKNPALIGYQTAF